MLEEIEASPAEGELRSGQTPPPEFEDPSEKPKRKPLPDSLLAEELVYEAPCNCPTCGGTSFLKASDRVVQVLEHVPASVKIGRHVEKRMICRGCDTTVAGEMPTLPIERGKPGPGLLVHIMIASLTITPPLPPVRDVRPVGDRHLPIRDGRLGRPRIRFADTARHVGQGPYCSTRPNIRPDDTPIDVLGPGWGKTKTGMVWVYVFDGSGYQSATPAAIAYYYSPDRKGAHPADHMASFSGVMHADGYGGDRKL